MKDHRDIDRRSLAFGEAIAARLRSHPELLTRAKQNLARWLVNGSPSSRPDLLEWEAAVNGPFNGVIALLTDPGEKATRLRQSNPFAGVLPNEERNAILRRFADHEAA